MKTRVSLRAEPRIQPEWQSAQPNSLSKVRSAVNMKLRFFLLLAPTNLLASSVLWLLFISYSSYFLKSDHPLAIATKFSTVIGSCCSFDPLTSNSPTPTYNFDGQRPLQWCDLVSLTFRGECCGCYRCDCTSADCSSSDGSDDSPGGATIHTGAAQSTAICPAAGAHSRGASRRYRQVSNKRKTQVQIIA